MIRELSQVVGRWLEQRLRSGPLRLEEAIEGFVRDHYDLWAAVERDLARERLRTIVHDELGRMAKRPDERQMILPGVPVALYVGNQWKTPEDMRAAELPVHISWREKRLARMIARTKEVHHRRSKAIKDEQHHIERLRRVLKSVRSFINRSPDIPLPVAMALKAERVAKKAAARWGKKRAAAKKAR